MSTMKTDAERLAEFDKKLEQIKAQKKAFQSRMKSKERKERTHRLIQIGASVEKVLGRPIEKEDLPKLISFLEQQEARGNYFSNAMKPDPAPSSEQAGDMFSSLYNEYE